MKRITIYYKNGTQNIIFHKGIESVLKEIKYSWTKNKKQIKKIIIEAELK